MEIVFPSSDSPPLPPEVQGVAGGIECISSCWRQVSTGNSMDCVFVLGWVQD